MSHWRPTDTPRPTFLPIVRNEPLTAEERAALAPYREVYPLLEWVSTPELHRLAFMRWYWRNGDER